MTQACLNICAFHLLGASNSRITCFVHKFHVGFDILCFFLSSSDCQTSCNQFLCYMSLERCRMPYIAILWNLIINLHIVTYCYMYSMRYFAYSLNIIPTGSTIIYRVLVCGWIDLFWEIVI